MMLKRGTILLLALILLCSIVSAEDWPGGQVSATASDYFRDVRSDGTNIYVAFIDTSGFDVEFSYSNDFGSTWHDSTVDANVPGMNAVFTHYTGGELFVIYQLGTGVWTAKSIDGGNEWGKSQSLPSATGYFSFDGYGGYFFVPYYSGTNLVMGKSENAGDNYLTSTITTSAKSPNPGIPGVYALDSDNVFVAYHNGSSGYIALAKTIDSGDNWELMPVVSETAGYLYVYASDVNHIFVLYRTGTTYKIAITSDGGSTWSAHTVGTGGTGYFDLAGIGNNIFVSYAPSDNKLHEHYSYDNGATWTDQIVNSSANYLSWNSIDAPSANKRVVVSKYFSNGYPWFFKYIVPEPTATEFTGSETTNFSLVDVSNITNLVLSNGDVTVAWNYPVNATDQDYDSQINLGTDYVSINVSQLDQSINSSANISMPVDGCTTYTIYYYSDFVSNFNDIKNNGQECNDGTDPACTSITCSGNMLSFTVEHFDSFGGEGQGGDAVPEFSTVAMIVALLGAVMGFFVIRQKV